LICYNQSTDFQSFVAERIFLLKNPCVGYAYYERSIGETTTRNPMKLNLKSGRPW
jgi:hypothetical protein